MRADDTMVYLNKKEREALQRVLKKFAVDVSLVRDWYYREEMEKDTQILQDRLDAAIKETSQN